MHGGLFFFIFSAAFLGFVYIFILLFFFFAEKRFIKLSKRIHLTPRSATDKQAGKLKQVFFFSLRYRENRQLFPPSFQSQGSHQTGLCSLERGSAGVLCWRCPPRLTLATISQQCPGLKAIIKTIQCH